MDLIKKYLPETYYADENSEARIKLFVEHWRRLVILNQELEDKLSSQLEPPIKPASGGQDITKTLHGLILKVEDLPIKADTKLGKEHTGYCKAISDVITILENQSRLSV